MEVGVVAEVLECLPGIQTTLCSPQHCVNQTGAHACLHSGLRVVCGAQQAGGCVQMAETLFQKLTRTRQPPPYRLHYPYLCSIWVLEY